MHYWIQMQVNPLRLHEEYYEKADSRLALDDADGLLAKSQPKSIPC